MAEQTAKKLKTKFHASLVLLLVAVVSVTTATYAWFSLSNTTVVQDMVVQVGTSASLKARTAPSANLGDYTATIDNAMVETALGYPLNTLRLWSLTSGNGYDLYTQGANSASSGGTPAESTSKSYLELKLWFMSDANMNVYLNGDNSSSTANDGTTVYSATDNSSAQKPVEQAVRVSFTPYALRAGGNASMAADYTSRETAAIYEPNKNGATTLNGAAASQIPGGGSTQPTFDKLGTNAGCSKGTANESPFLFSLQANVPKLVVIRVWIEGEDPECKNGNSSSINIEQAKLITRLRFCGADDNGYFLEAGAVS